MGKSVIHKLNTKVTVISLLLFFAFSLVSCSKVTVDCIDGYMPNESDTECIVDPNYNTPSNIVGEGYITIEQFSDFDPTGLVTANDKEDGPLEVEVYSNNVDTSVPGRYEVIYKAEDSDGATVEYVLTVFVEEIPEVVTDGIIGTDLSLLDADQKAIIFATLERYLLENAYGGVPLFRSVDRVMFSNRLQLYSSTDNPVLGYGTEFSHLTEDDSTVLMYDGVYGNEGEYTYRTTFTTDPVTLNPWLAYDSISPDFIDLYTASLYKYYFNSSRQGFEVRGELASDNPQPINGIFENGIEYATVWRIPLKEDLTWAFHPNTDTSTFPVGYEVLDANDFIWTWKTALEKGWFQAVAGGSDFITHGVLNAAQFAVGNTTWDQVGLKVIDNQTLEITFTSSVSESDVINMFGRGQYTPINKELYELVNEETTLEVDAYGLTPESVASSGVYYFDIWTHGQLLYFKKNESFVDTNMYHYTAKQYRYIGDNNNLFEEFLTGRLESAEVPTTRVSEFVNDPRVKSSPSSYTWMLNFNAFGTREAQLDYIEENGSTLSSNFIPEPLLAYTEARLAFMYGFDRYQAAVDVADVFIPATDLFTETYKIDSTSNLGIRDTEAGEAILNDFGGESFGYYPDAAVDLFQQAVSKAIEDGYYSKGTEKNYTVIELSLTYASFFNLAVQVAVGDLEAQYESLLIDDDNYVKIDIVLNDVIYPSAYFGYATTASTDLSIGAINGSLIDAPAFLYVFCDNNISTYTLNWGIDTSSSNIKVVYRNVDGQIVAEMWSYNNLVNALNGN